MYEIYWLTSILSAGKCTEENRGTKIIMKCKKDRWVVKKKGKKGDQTADEDNKEGANMHG